MRPRTALPPLEKKKQPELPGKPLNVAARIRTAELIPEIREHFPEFEAELRLEADGLGFEIFANSHAGAGMLARLLVILARREYRRRFHFAMSLLRAGPAADALLAEDERFAIQTEGGDPGEQDQDAGGGRARRTSANHMAEPGAISP